MFSVRVAAFIISLLLVTNAVEPTQGWLIALAVFTGLSLLSWRGVRFAPWGWEQRWQRQQWRRWLDES